MSLKLSITNSFILAHGKFQEITDFRIADPVPPLDPRCHFDMMCECEKYINWQKDMLGLGGNTPKHKLKDCKFKILCNKLPFLSK